MVEEIAYFDLSDCFLDTVRRHIHEKVSELNWRTGTAEKVPDAKRMRKLNGFKERVELMDQEDFHDAIFNPPLGVGSNTLSEDRGALFVTDAGSIGTMMQHDCRESVLLKEGDRVVVLFGGKSLHILRPAPEG